MKIAIVESRICFCIIWGNHFIVWIGAMIWEIS